MVHSTPVTATDDLALAGRCAEGDRAAQREVFRTHKQRVHGTLYRILGSNRDMEDLVQDAFLEVFRSLPRFRGESKLATWITRITVRVAFQHIRRRKPATASLDVVPEMPADDPDAERAALAREAARRLYAVLDRIDPKMRIAFILHTTMDMGLREVAEATDASLTATKSRVWRARKEIERRAEKDPLLASFVTGGKP